MHKTVSFEIAQPNNQPSKHVLASVDITNWSPIDHLGCEGAFGAWGNGIEVALNGQVEKGQICMKEGEKGREDWLAMEWDVDVWGKQYDVKFDQALN
jgi:hypothetical protein